MRQTIHITGTSSLRKGKDRVDGIWQYNVPSTEKTISE